jgi:hypothetical protein
MGDPPTSIRRFNRLAALDRREVFDRARQYLTARVDVLRFGNHRAFEETTVEPEAPLGRFFFAPTDLPSLFAALRKDFPSQADEIIQRAERICQHRFDLLGYEHLDYGAEIDWHLDVVHGKRSPRKPWFKIKYLDFEEVGDSKVTWELNRHQYFVTLAKAYGLTGDEQFVREILALWAHWHKENPYPIGMNWASSLEVGFRTLSWIWTFFLLQQSPLFTIDLREQWQAALSLNGRHIDTYLSTYFSPNTHLLGEALALFFLGTLFPGFPSAARWKHRGWNILEREATKQVREDGFYFEQSTYYHVYALDMFLHARILAGLNGVEISTGFDRILQRMLNALALLGRAGVPPSLGDDDGGRIFDPRRNRAEHMLDPLATGAVLYRRGDFKFLAGSPREETLWLLGAKGLADFASLPGTKPQAGSTALIDSGFYLMADESSNQQLLIDAGPLGAGSGGHGHADALSVCLVKNGKNILIDPGTFEYVGPSGERVRLRGTAAHNTMQVDGCDQTEQARPFSWKRFPRVTVEQWITGKSFDLFQGSHDGYARLASHVTHRRWVFHKKGEFWLVRDLAEGTSSHELDIAWHLAPSLVPYSSGQLRFNSTQLNFAVLSVEASRWSHHVREDSYSPAYGLKEKMSSVSLNAIVDLPANFATLLIAGENLPADIGQLVRLEASMPGAACGYRYSNSRQEHIFFFASSTPWSLATWASDAEFLYCSFDREEEICALILCNGTYADAGGRRVLTCRQRVRYAEISSLAGKVEILSSHPGDVELNRPLDRVWAEEHPVARGDDSEGTGV